MRETKLADIFTILLSVDEEAALVLDVDFSIEPLRTSVGGRWRDRRIVVPAVKIEKCADAGHPRHVPAPD